MIFDKSAQAASVDKRWVAGGIFGLEIPADAGTLVSAGADFLTKAFHTSGALAAANRVSNGYKDDRNCLGRVFECHSDWGALAEDAVAL